MNHKLLKASIAGAAVIALAAGGSTYAAWSDFATWTGNDSGAGTMTLSTTAPASQAFQVGNLIPGGVWEQETYLLSNKGDSTPNGTISLSLSNLVGQEGGCGTGNQVKLDDPDCATDTVGEFPSDAQIFIKTTAADEANCRVTPAGDSTPPGFEKAIYGVLDQAGTNQANAKSLSDLEATSPIQLVRPGTATTTFDPAVYKPGEGVCAAIYIYLPKTVDNEVQGDSATFDLTATLNQAF